MTASLMLPTLSTADDLERVTRVKTAEKYLKTLSARTLRNYVEAWRQFSTWCDARQQESLPAHPLTVSRYVEEQGQRLTAGTLNIHIAAIGCQHRVMDLDNPCATVLVRSTYSVIAREQKEAGWKEKQATPLTAAALARIEQTACRQRPGRGGYLEPKRRAQIRGNLDFCICIVMRDAGLRVSEAERLTWGEIEYLPNGTGQLFIPISKTDKYGEGSVQHLTRRAVIALQAVACDRAAYAKYDKNSIGPEDRVFQLGARQIFGRIRAAARAAGLKGNFTAHSPRVGMAHELSGRGAATHEIQLAGRWGMERMVLRYTRGIAAKNGAVARYLED